MLVLTRRTRERIVFPGINTSVQVVAVKSGAVRLGIEAPPEVAVFREELLARDESPAPVPAPPPGRAAPPTLCQLSHLLRDWLDVAAIGLALLHRQARAGLTEDTLDLFDREVGALRQQMQGMGRRPLPKSRVLLVEDDQGGRDSLAGSLRLAGLQVATASGGGEALADLRAEGLPDVLLLDMRLPPPCDGPSLVRAVRRERAYTGLKIFGVTSGGPGHFGLAGDGGGVDHWFDTPLDAEAVLQDLNQELAGVV
jgi:carbon storage regulator CsrA